MGYRIPEETIEKIRHSVDIVDVISEYVQLKKQGRNYFGLCPFHGESTPSFSVSPDKQIYHCFGCGAGGNALSFIMDIDGITFTEAAKRLADRVNIELPNLETDPIHPQKQQDSTMMIEAHELLKKFYHHLLVNTKEGEHALDYLLNRGFSMEEIEKFEIGFALDSWDFASKFLVQRGFKQEMMEKAGLIIKKESDGSYFDRFRNRIMFPIWDHQGKTIAFSGRVLETNTREPKYLNSPETIIFNKSKTLYNFHNARPFMRKNEQVVLFEGFMDVISANRADIPYSIATMGTSLTEEQAKMIRRNVESVTICYDGDSAGIEATVRAAAILKDIGCYVKVASMPEGLDPDDYVKKYGPEHFKGDVIGASLTLMAFKMRYFRKGKNLQDEGEKIKYIQLVLNEIGKLDNAVEKDHYLRTLSNEFSISLDALKEQHEQINKSLQNKKDNDDRNRNNIPRKPLLAKKLLPAYHNAERLLIAHMLRDKDITYKVHDALQGDFNIEEHRAIVLYLYAYYEEGNDPDIGTFIQRLNNEKLKSVVTEIAMQSINEEVSELELTDYIKQVLKHQKLSMIKEKEVAQQEAERQSDFKRAATIAMEILQLRRTINSR
ncbi:DNA primase [Bacillus luteolus]|uniref:DNA primase n=1 Tax=Litchfieldia luteola TaxID=682179 RepID=A0ABR9QHP6_9BACI|nr:DNA primase [Cytobacillus luteolus]MBE4908010.1 DNA primase [Cytobacillus luteolus]MBP1942793.1 DNA primase [Cytobacillus luteolus]